MSTVYEDEKSIGNYFSQDCEIEDNIVITFSDGIISGEVIKFIDDNNSPVKERDTKEILVDIFASNDILNIKCIDLKSNEIEEYDVFAVEYVGGPYYINLKNIESVKVVE